MSRNQWIAVVVGLGLIVYLFFSQPLVELFSANNSNTNNNTETMTQESNSGLVVQDVVVGTGEEAMAGDVVSAHYVGKLTDGRVFDSSVDRGVPINFTLGVGQVIRGWDEGLKGMKVGGKRVLTIAPEYGYGAQAVGSIPANSTLVFEVELVGVEKSGQ